MKHNLKFCKTANMRQYSTPSFLSRRESVFMVVSNKNNTAPWCARYVHCGSCRFALFLFETSIILRNKNLCIRALDSRLLGHGKCGGFAMVSGPVILSFAKVAGFRDCTKKTAPRAVFYRFARLACVLFGYNGFHLLQTRCLWFATVVLQADGTGGNDG